MIQHIFFNRRISKRWNSLRDLGNTSDVLLILSLCSFHCMYDSHIVCWGRVVCFLRWWKDSYKYVLEIMQTYWESLTFVWANIIHFDDVRIYLVCILETIMHLTFPNTSLVQTFVLFLDTFTFNTCTLCTYSTWASTYHINY